MAGFHYFQRVDRRQMSLDLVNEGRNVGIPYANFMIKTCAEQKDHGFIESYTQNTSCVLSIGPLLLWIDGVPEHQFTVHPTRGHELELRHGDHTGDESVGSLLTLVIMSFGEGTF